MTSGRVTRRDFLRTTAGAIGAAAAGAALAGPALGGYTGRVVKVHSPSATVDFIAQQGPIREMVRAGLGTLTGGRTAEDAIATLFPVLGPEERILVKVNAAGSVIPVGTRCETIRAMVELLRTLPTTDGRTVRGEQITVWDNAPMGHVREAVDDLCEVAETYRPTNWDLVEGTSLELPHAPDESDLLTQRVVIEADHLVNMSALKHHILTGTTGSMKNYYGAVTRAWDLHSHGPWIMTRKTGPWTVDTAVEMRLATDDGDEAVLKIEPGTYEDEALVAAIRPQLEGRPFQCSPFRYAGQHLLLASTSAKATEMTVEGSMARALGIPEVRCFRTDISQTVPEIYACPQLGGKTRLNLIDGVLGLYDKGPYSEPQEWITTPEPTPNLLLLSTDPVAIDTAMTDIVLPERERHDDLESPEFDLGYLEYAEAIGLGVGSRHRVIKAAVR